MKISIWQLTLSLIGLSALFSAPALAQTDSLAANPPAPPFYDNGPILGKVGAFLISGGMVADTFTEATVKPLTSITFGVWIANCSSPSACGLTSVNLSIGTSIFGSDVANFVLVPVTTATSLPIIPGLPFFPFCKPAGCTVYSVTAQLGDVPLSQGTTYWLTLSGATNALGSSIYWDVNNGVGCLSVGFCPSRAATDLVLNVPSEAFTLN